jgi:hypothetical protein
MRSRGLSATAHAYVEFGTAEEADRCRQKGTLPDADFSWKLGTPPPDASGRIVEMDLHIAPKAIR